MKNNLPQNERNSQLRTKYLQGMQEKYQYAYEYSETIAVVRKLPWREFPGFRYLILSAKNLLWLIPSLPSLSAKFIRYLLGGSLQNYRDFVFYPLSP